MSQKLATLLSVPSSECWVSMREVSSSIGYMERYATMWRLHTKLEAARNLWREKLVTRGLKWADHVISMGNSRGLRRPRWRPARGVSQDHGCQLVESEGKIGRRVIEVDWIAHTLHSNETLEKGLKHPPISNKSDMPTCAQ